MSTALTPHSVDSYLLVASGFIAALLLRRLVDGPSAQERIDANLPAFPPGLPFIGNVHQVAGRRPELQFTEWSKTLGPIFTVKMGVKRWIVLNSIDIVKDLIVDRGNIYSSRDLPEVLLNVLFRGDMGAPMPFMSYGDRWRQIRRIAHSALTKAKINNYQPIIDIRSNFMLKSLYEASCSSPENVVAPVAIFDFYTVSTMFAVIFGVDIKPNDERIKRGNEVTQEATRLIGLPEQLMEFFPLLKNMPIKTAKLAAAIRSKTEAFWGEQYAGVKKRVQEGTAGECVLREVIATQPKERLGDLQQSHIGSILNSAGSETTSITIQWMCAILAHYPEIQEKAFAEIEQVVGLDRLPTENDEENLPYIQCIILETLRYRAPAPVAIPHATSKDDTYRGYFIPKGTTVVINIHAIHNDPKRYPNPKLFNPERHMNYVRSTNNKITPEFSERPHLAFSTGRRVCVGINMAERVLFIGIAKFLSCFRIQFPTDEFGSPVPIEIEKPKVGNGTTCIPRPYEVKLVPRHNGVGKLVGSEF